MAASLVGAGVKAAQRLPKAGLVWPKSQRKLWLQLLESSFDLVYQEGRENNQPKMPKPEENEPAE